MTISQPIWFGPLAAQDDPDLLNYFVKSQELRELAEGTNVRGGTRFIVVSRPGAGKTAAFKWLSSDSSGITAIVIRGSNHRILPSDGFFNVDDYVTLAFGELAVSLILQSRKQFSLTGAATAHVRSFRAKRAVKDVAGIVGERFQGLNVLGFGITLNPSERAAYIDRLRQRDFQIQLEKLLSEIAVSVQPVLVIDDPESMIGTGLETLSRENAIRLGALLSALSRIDALGYRVQVFIREQIYRSVAVNYEHVLHYSDRVRGLGWTSEDLIAVLRRRVVDRLHLEWRQAFVPAESQLAVQLFPYLVNGPRDLLNICNVAGTNGAPIDKETLRRALDRVCGERPDELQRQFGPLYPDFETFVSAALKLLRWGTRSRLFTSKEAEDLIAQALIDPESELGGFRQSHEWVEQLRFSRRQALELLFTAGCIGYKTGSQSVYPWAGRSVEQFTLADKYFVSKAFLSE